MDALYVLYRETRQGQKAAEMLERMLAQPALEGRAAQGQAGVVRARRDRAATSCKDVDGAVEAFNAALDLDHRFIEAFSAHRGAAGRRRSSGSRWRRTTRG